VLTIHEQAYFPAQSHCEIRRDAEFDPQDAGATTASPENPLNSRWLPCKFGT
jgi:hypothetical protein